MAIHQSLQGKDIMAVYEDHKKMFREFSEVLKIDMNRFKSIWGLMLWILLLSTNRP